VLTVLNDYELPYQLFCDVGNLKTFEQCCMDDACLSAIVHVQSFRTIFHDFWERGIQGPRLFSTTF